MWHRAARCSPPFYSPRSTLHSPFTTHHALTLLVRGTTPYNAPMQRIAFAAVLIGYLALATGYAALTPEWQAPDEPAHYNVVRQIAQTGALPVLAPGDYDQDYLSQVISAGFPPDAQLDRIQYQDYQPPLYYILAVPAFWLGGGALLPVRLVSVLFGAGALIFAYLALSALARPGSWLPALTVGLIAFIPQHLAILASVNNDSLSELWVCAGAWLAVREARAAQPLGRPWAGALPLVLGLAFLTKVWAYVLVPVVGVLLLWQWRRFGLREAARRGLLIVIPALLLGALYWGRNLVVCGPADFVCGAHHNSIVVGQPTAAAGILAAGGLTPYMSAGLQTTFTSFWGQFGWMGVPLDPRTVKILMVTTAVALLGGLIAFARAARALTIDQRWSLALIATLGLSTAGVFIYYNLGFQQFQGRYLYSALLPLALVGAAGLREWVRLTLALAKRLTPIPAWLEPALSLSGISALALFAAWALVRVVVPNLS